VRNAVPFDETELIASDGLPLRAWSRSPVFEPEGCIAFVHGLGEYSARYARLAEFWVRHGFVVAGFDLRGHGKSGGPRGHTPSYDQMLDDIATFLAYATSTPWRLPVTLYGHSMGGGLVLNYAIRRQPPVSSVVASAPYLRLAFQPPAWKLRLAHLFRNLAPAYSQPAALELAALTRDVAEIERYANDPLIHDRISVSLFNGAHTAGEEAIARAGELRVPVLLIHGTADRITDAAGSEAFVHNSRGRATLKRCEGFFHEIHNDPGWEDVEAFVLSWIRSVR